MLRALSVELQPTVASRKILKLLSEKESGSVATRDIETTLYRLSGVGCGDYLHGRYAREVQALPKHFAKALDERVFNWLPNTQLKCQSHGVWLWHR